MLPVIIVEDNDSQRKRMEEAIRDYVIIEDIDVEISLSTANPYECLKYIEANPNVRGLYFIDVDLGVDMDGIELGKHIKRRDPNGRIVMVTTKGELAVFTFVYKLEVLDYIVKESVEEVISKIRKCVQIAYNRYKALDTTERRVVEIKIGNRTRSVPIEEVCFIETSKREHHLILHGKNSRVEFRGYMRECVANNPTLLRTHRAYLVNMDNVDFFDEKQNRLKMLNGKYCYVAIRKRSVVKGIIQEKEKWF